MTTLETLKAARQKMVGLLHWWLQLAPIRHRHWCPTDGDPRCYHASICWYCEGAFCVDLERKKCAGCEASNPCKHRLGAGTLCGCQYHT